MQYKFISAKGESEFNQELSEWFKSNEDKKIISISHSATNYSVPTGIQNK